MAKVLCSLENASEVISGVRFERGEHGMVSEDISSEQAAAFCAINGYAREDDATVAAAAEKAQAARQANRRKQAKSGQSADLAPK